MREKEGMRETLERIITVTGKDVLKKKDVQQFTGMSREWVRTHIRFNEMGVIAAADLARQLMR